MYNTQKKTVKKQMADALITLLSQKPYIDITVTDLVNTAQVARVSFYRNFASVSDVLDYITDELTKEFFEKILPVLNSNDDTTWRIFLAEFIQHGLHDKSKIEAMNLNNTSILFSHLNAKMQMLVSSVSHKSLNEKYTSYVKASLINNIIKKWMDDGMTETPEELIDYIISFITLF